MPLVLYVNQTLLPINLLRPQGESTSVELDITVPPWSGAEEMEVTFRPVPFNTDQWPGYEHHAHHWRICRVDIVMVSEVLLSTTL